MEDVWRPSSLTGGAKLPRAGVERKRRLTRSPLLFLDRLCLCVFWGFWVLEEIAIIFMLYSRIASGAKIPRQLFSPQRA